MTLQNLKDKIKDWEITSSRREKILLFIVTVIIPAFLFYRFYYAPSQEKIKGLQEEIKKLELEIAKMEIFAKKEKELEEQLKQRKFFLEEIKQILPTEQEVPKLLKDVSMLAKKNGLEILNFTPRGEEKRDYYNIIPFDVQIKGTFVDTLKFFNEVERLARLVKLNSLEITPLEKEEKLTAKINFITYKYTGEPIEKKDKK
ncbi:MAG: type 4a pilus biogenesis protein PilO [Caldimicrobium sp.]|nr:type 4a pilus biogenesis protein PilO [Caldimicrobium sp.]MDW8183389.1 type 4a pilus biogenesis protein PilO [Caldimicrobium sp.]